MHIFPPGDDARDNDIVTPVFFPVLENHFRSLASGGSFVLGPGYQGIENGQLPQALPGQPHDGSLPVSSSPQAAAAPLFPASEIPQSAVGASNPLTSATSGSQQMATSAEPASALPSGSSSAQVNLLSYPTCSCHDLIVLQISAPISVSPVIVLYPDTCLQQP
jgi:hypothetical protein